MLPLTLSSDSHVFEPNGEPVGVELILAGVGAKEAHRGLAILDRRYGYRPHRGPQAVVETHNRVALGRECCHIGDLNLIGAVPTDRRRWRTELPARHGILVADTKAAAVDPDDDGRRTICLRGEVQVELLRG